jgi:hypothetical protein
MTRKDMHQHFKQQFNHVIVNNHQRALALAATPSICKSDMTYE